MKVNYTWPNLDFIENSLSVILVFSNGPIHKKPALSTTGKKLIGFTSLWFQAVVSNGRSSQVAALVATGCQLRGRGWNSTLKLAVALRSSPGQTCWISPSSLPFRTDSSLTSTENQRKINQGQFVHWQFHCYSSILGQAKFLRDLGLRLHHWVWPKTCAHTNVGVPRTSF